MAVQERVRHVSRDDEVEEDENEVQWIQVAFRVGVPAIMQPLEYAKILIQIGYEPIAPRPTRTIFGKPALALPGIFEYIGFMRKQVGFFGLYRGVTARVCGSVVSGYVSSKVSDCIKIPESPEKPDTDEEKILIFVQTTIRDSISRTAAVIACQPFQVITIRIMAQFVGEEVKYSGIFSSVREIFKNDGLSGFFSGVMPRLIGELVALWLASSLSFMLNTYLIEDKDLQNYSSASMSFIASTLTYPFNLVSNVMCVNDSGLLAGCPPNMPIYGSWIDCWKHLSSQNQLKRGSSLLWRYYTGPQILVAGQPKAVTLQSYNTPRRHYGD